MTKQLQDRVRKAINASGRMTKLGVSTQSKSVQDAMLYGSSNYVLIDELYRESGNTIADLLDVPAAAVTSSASAGIVLSISSLICKDNQWLTVNLHNQLEKITKREVIIPKGHSVNYGVPISTMIELGGGKVIEAGCANMVTKQDVIGCINENTIALLYVKSSHSIQKDMISFLEMVEIAKEYQIPLIIDCAAEINLTSFILEGADYAIYSGSKALEGPTSGFVLCSSLERADWIRKQNYGIGRCMKIGKENIYGLVQAITDYVEKKQVMKVTYSDLDHFIEAVNQLSGLSAIKAQDESGREIYRAKVHFDQEVYGHSALEMIQLLEAGNPAIYTRNYEANLGYLAFDPRPLQSVTELEYILEKLTELGGK